MSGCKCRFDSRESMHGRMQLACFSHRENLHGFRDLIHLGPSTIITGVEGLPSVRITGVSDPRGGGGE